MVLGKGSGLSIAKEGALKIKEMTYIHAEAFSAGEMKHGPIALLEPERNKTKVILIIMDDENLQEMLLALDECKARESFTIVITNCPKRITKGDYIIPVVG
jgi:glucosamine--fructose-6-phosphate aminotransferase (isomerizing)